MSNEAKRTSEWINQCRAKYPSSWIWKIPDEGKKEKPLDVLMFYNQNMFAIEFKYKKEQLSIDKLTKLLQLNQILTISEITKNGGFGVLGLFYPGGLDLYLYQRDGGRKQIGSDIMSALKHNE